MRRRRNWAAWIGLALGVLAFATYMVALGLRIGPPTSTARDTAIVNLALIGAGLGFSVLGIRRAVGRGALYRGRWTAPLLAALNVSVAVLFLLFLFPMATLPPPGNVPRVGTAAPEFALPDENGTVRHLADLRGQNVLLVFYRGHW